MSVTVRIFLSRNGLIEALRMGAKIRTIRVIRHQDIFLTDLLDEQGLKIAEQLHTIKDAVAQNPDIDEG